MLRPGGRRSAVAARVAAGLFEAEGPAVDRVLWRFHERPEHRLTELDVEEGGRLLDQSCARVARLASVAQDGHQHFVRGSGIRRKWIRRGGTTTSGRRPLPFHAPIPVLVRGG